MAVMCVLHVSEKKHGKSMKLRADLIYGSPSHKPRADTMDDYGKKSIHAYLLILLSRGNGRGTKRC